VLLLEAGIYSPAETLKANIMEWGIMELRKLMKLWYKQQRQLRPGVQLSVIDSLTVNMLGDLSTPCLHARGGEARCIFGFVLQQMMKHAPSLGENARK
jgi:hypothetical protein